VRAYDTRNNNYENSEIRAWLNDQFIETAFNSAQKNFIPETLVDNSAESTGIANNPYICEDTSDKTFLLSYKEAFQDGCFNSNVERKITDYTKALKACEENGYGSIWLRSPDNNNVNTILISVTGAKSTSNITFKARGIVPALTINLA